MQDIKEIRANTNRVLSSFEKLAHDQENICTGMTTSGVGTGTYPGLAELEELRSQTENLRRQLQALGGRSKLDAEVLEIERKLDEALSRYYWLWHKCKDNMYSDKH